MTEQQPPAPPHGDAPVDGRTDRPDSQVGAAFPPPSGRPVRPPGAGRGRVTKLMALLIAAVCVLVAGVAVKYSPELGEAQIKRASVGEPVRFYKATVTLTDVKVGTLKADDYDEGEYEESKGMLVALTFVVEAPEEKQRISAGSLHANGDRVYKSIDFDVIRPEAGYRATGTVLYEVDPDHIDDLWVEVGDGEIFYGYSQKLHIRLGITEENADAWRKAAQGRAVKAESPPRVEALP